MMNHEIIDTIRLLHVDLKNGMPLNKMEFPLITIQFRYKLCICLADEIE